MKMNRVSMKVKCLEVFSVAFPGLLYGNLGSKIVTVNNQQALYIRSQEEPKELHTHVCD